LRWGKRFPPKKEMKLGVPKNQTPATTAIVDFHTMRQVGVGERNEDDRKKTQKGGKKRTGVKKQLLF